MKRSVMNKLMEQKAIEIKTSMNTLDDLISDTVRELDIKPMIEKFDEYMDKLSKVDSKRRDAQIATINAIDKELIIKTALRTLMKEKVLSNSYTERNVVAFRIGKKLVSKSLSLKTCIEKSSICLSVGLIVIEIFKYINIITLKRNTLKNPANKYAKVYSIEIKEGIVTKEMIETFKSIRASNFMIHTPLDHTEEKGGGYYTVPGTMLNSKGYNNFKYQTDTANIAINKLQKVKYTIRDNFEADLIKSYGGTSKWYGTNLMPMTKEWDKFIDDLQCATNTREIYFPMKYDDRGRIYDTSAYIKIQGDKFQKSLLVFKKKEVCTKEGLDFLKIALANELDLGSLTFEQSIKYIDTKGIPFIQRRIKRFKKINPIAITLLKDLESAMKGEAIGTVTHWDCTNSGLQVYSMIGKDKETAKLCNIVKERKPADAYKTLADKLNKITDSSNFTRENVKTPFMTFLYGAMMKTIMASGIEPFGDLFPKDFLILQKWSLFKTAMKEIAPSAISIMNLIFTFNCNGRSKFEWTMPDGFKVSVTSTKIKGRDDGIKGWFMDLEGKNHEGSASVRLEEYDKMSRALAPNIVHSIDSYILREIVKKCTFNLAVIHDSFGCHPNNASKLHEVTRKVCAKIVDNDILVNILKDICPKQAEKNVEMGKVFKGTLKGKDVLNSRYILK